MYKIYKIYVDGKPAPSIFGWSYIVRFNKKDAIGFGNDGSLYETTILDEEVKAEAYEGLFYDLVDITDSVEDAKEFILLDIKINKTHVGETNV